MPEALYDWKAEALIKRRKDQHAGVGEQTLHLPGRDPAAADSRDVRAAQVVLADDDELLVGKSAWQQFQCRCQPLVLEVVSDQQDVAAGRPLLSAADIFIVVTAQMSHHLPH